MGTALVAVKIDKDTADRIWLVEYEILKTLIQNSEPLESSVIWDPREGQQKAQ